MDRIQHFPHNDLSHLFKLTSIGQGLLIFGGNNSKDWIGNVDALVPGSNYWKKVGDMPKSGGYWGAAALPGHIFLMGGKGDSSSISDSCLRYDFPTNEWFEASLLTAFLHSGTVKFCLCLRMCSAASSLPKQ